MNEKELAGYSISEIVICEMARKLHSDWLQEKPSANATSDEVKANRRWFDKSHKRSGIHSATSPEAFSSDKAVVGAYEKELAKIMKAEGKGLNKCLTMMKHGSSGRSC